MPRKTVTYRGKQYRQVYRNEKIAKGAIHRIGGASCHPISSHETVGQTPTDFNPQRMFFNPVEE